jgi:hypothetical protein
LRIVNMRAKSWWKFREELNSHQECRAVIAPSPDSKPGADIAASTSEVTARGILIEDKDKISKRIGCSPGKGDAVVMCWSEGQIAIKGALRAIGKARQAFAIMDLHRARVQWRRVGERNPPLSTPRTPPRSPFLPPHTIEKRANKKPRSES